MMSFAEGEVEERCLAFFAVLSDHTLLRFSLHPNHHKIYYPKGCIIMNKELYRAARFRSAVLMLTVGVAMIHVVHKYSNRKKF
jgi:hypothetical protein